MRLKNIKGSEETVKNSIYTINDFSAFKGNYKSMFKKEIHVEIGSGRGRFIYEMAKQNPKILFIAIDIHASVLLKLIKKLENDHLDNLKIMRLDAKDILDVFYKDIDVLYLNFSDPWPKKRHQKRRLTSDLFLEKYDHIFYDKQKIVLKTDNEELFKYSIVKFSEHSYKIEYITFDLHKENIFNIETEYEEKFCKKNFKIFKTIVYK